MTFLKVCIPSCFDGSERMDHAIPFIHATRPPVLAHPPNRKPYLQVRGKK